MINVVIVIGQAVPSPRVDWTLYLKQISIKCYKNERCQLMSSCHHFFNYTHCGCYLTYNTALMLHICLKSD